MRRSKRKIHPENIIIESKKKDRKILKYIYIFLFGTLIVGCAV